MDLKSIPMVALIVGMIFLGSITYIGNLGLNYQQTADYSGLNQTEVKMIEMQDSLNSTYARLQNDIINPDQGQSLFMPYSMLVLAWDSIKIIFGSLGIFGTLFNDINVVLSENGIAIPTWFIGGVISIIMLFIIIMGIYALFKWKVED